MNATRGRGRAPKTVPKPEENDAWMSLCRDPRWKFRDGDDNEQDGSNSGNPDLFFAEGWDLERGAPEQSAENRIRIAPASEGLEYGADPSMHRGALAPKFVFEAANEPSDDGMDVYMQRLICVLCKRFVIISRPSAGDVESLAASGGMPQEGVRYWWRYWDNEGNVYQVNMEKFRDSAGTMRNTSVMYGLPPSYRDVKEATFHHGMPPGEFVPTADSTAWMRVSAGLSSTGKECTDLSGFFDHAWSFAHHGTTRVPLWDASLIILSRLAGVPEEKKCCRNCANHVEHVLLRCSRCKLVHYCKNDSCQSLDWPDHKQMCKYFPKASDTGPPTRRSRPKEDVAAASLHSAADDEFSSSRGQVGPDGLPVEPCTSLNFFGYPGLNDRQRLRWALRTEADIRFAKLQARDEQSAGAPTDKARDDDRKLAAGSDDAEATGGVPARDDTLNSEFLIDLYPSSGGASATEAASLSDGITTEADRIFLRDREHFGRKLISALAVCRDPDASFSTLAELDIQRPQGDRLRQEKEERLKEMPAAPPNLLYFELFLEGYMGYRVPNYHHPDVAIPRGAVMGGAVVAALTAWRYSGARRTFSQSLRRTGLLKKMAAAKSPESKGLASSYVDSKKRVLRDLNDYFLHDQEGQSSPYSLGDVDIFLQLSPHLRALTERLSHMGVYGDAMGVIGSFTDENRGIIQDDLRRFTDALCGDYLEKRFCQEYDYESSGYRDFQTDHFVYALGRNGLSFTLALGGKDHSNANEGWPRVTQLIMLDAKADLVGALLDFDTSVAACAYDGVAVRVAPRAAFSLLTSTQVVTPNALQEKRNRSRIVKYFKRGFSAYMIDPYCAHRSQCTHDLDLAFPFFSPSETLSAGRRRKDHWEGNERTSWMTTVEWKARDLHGPDYFDRLTEVEGNLEELCITACCYIAQGPDNRSVALFEVEPGHAASFFAKRHAWTEEDIHRVAGYDAAHHFACEMCRFEYAIWLIFSRDPAARLIGDELRSEVSLFAFQGYKGGFTHLCPSFYGCGAFNSKFVRDSARSVNATISALHSQTIAERAKYLVDHLGEECATFQHLKVFTQGASTGHCSIDRFVYDQDLNGVFVQGKSTIFPGNTRAPVGLNPERFVEICQQCNSYMVACEFGTTKCKQCNE